MRVPVEDARSDLEQEFLPDVLPHERSRFRPLGQLLKTLDGRRRNLAFPAKRAPVLGPTAVLPTGVLHPVDFSISFVEHGEHSVDPPLYLLKREITRPRRKTFSGLAPCLSKRSGNVPFLGVKDTEGSCHAVAILF
jgi:hypothetical protein